MKPRIAITLGDPAGIGPEIVSKARGHPRVRACCDPVIVGDPIALSRRVTLGRPSRDGGCFAVESLRLATVLIRTGQARAMVTAPVSKESFHLAGIRTPGHTEWLAQECHTSSVAMLMVAGRLRALLMTRHVPLRDVTTHLNSKLVQQSALLGYRFVKKYILPRPRLVICGLNPHAGDNGLIGKEEKMIFLSALRSLKKKGIRIAGPVGADTVFRDMAKGTYDLALAAYHDQGMIPLKLYAPDQLVNITLGLPFIRTSPGHGTAYDIAGRGRANPNPMIEAICLAAQYSA